MKSKGSGTMMSKVHNNGMTFMDDGQPGMGETRSRYRLGTEGSGGGNAVGSLASTTGGRMAPKEPKMRHMKDGERNAPVGTNQANPSHGDPWS